MTTARPLRARKTRRRDDLDLMGISSGALPFCSELI